jgi:hypothetical protein
VPLSLPTAGTGLPGHPEANPRQSRSGIGGFYSWDLLDNAGRPSANRVHLDWQNLAVGDRLKCLGLPSYAVATLEPNRLLGLYWLADLRGRWLDPSQPRPAAYMEGYWAFQLKELSDGRTRLVIDGYQAARPRWFERLMYDWVFPVMVWIMQARMLVVLKRNIERTITTPGNAGCGPASSGGSNSSHDHGGPRPSGSVVAPPDVELGRPGTLRSATPGWEGVVPDSSQPRAWPRTPAGSGG